MALNKINDASICYYGFHVDYFSFLISLWKFWIYKVYQSNYLQTWPGLVSLSHNLKLLFRFFREKNLFILKAYFQIIPVLRELSNCIIKINLWICCRFSLRSTTSQLAFELNPTPDMETFKLNELVRFSDVTACCNFPFSPLLARVWPCRLMKLIFVQLLDWIVTSIMIKVKGRLV